MTVYAYVGSDHLTHSLIFRFAVCTLPLRIQLFRERLSEKVQATIPQGIEGGFEFTVL